MSSTGKVNAALAAAVIFLLLSSCSAYFAFNRMDASQSWVRHTRDVQSALAQFSMATARAGRLRSEYVDSGDAALLPQQAEVVSQIRNAVAIIQRLTADNAQQQANCRKLDQLKEQRITLLDQAIELKKSGKSTPAAQAKFSRESLATAESTDLLLQHMYDTEDQLLDERQARASRFTSLTAAILATTLFLALVLFMVHHQLLMDQVSARSRAELAQRALSAKLLTLQDEERRKFARELNDSVGQQLAALKMALAMLQAKLPNDTSVQDCLQLADDSIAETRTISHLLHPPLLDEAGLNSACRWFVEGFGKRSGIDVKLDIADGTGRLPEATELVLFRVLQESLTNVHRHSGAKSAEVSLQTAGRNVILRVRDYGNGMPPGVLQSLRENGSAGGVGVAGMTERIREIGGKLEVNSSAIGTEIVARVPVYQKAANKSSPPRLQEVRMNGKILSIVIGSIFLVAASGCTKSSAPQVVVEIPTGFTGNFQLEMGVREAPPLQKRGGAYVVSVPRNGKVVTSTLLTDSQPIFQNSTDGAVWGYSLSLSKTGDGIPIGGRIEFFVGTKKEYEAEQGKKNHSQGVFTPADSIAWNLT